MRASVTIALIALLAPVAGFLAPAVWAKPPASEGFVRFVMLKKAEEFKKKPFPEKLLIRWSEGESSFESVRKLNGEAVVKAIFEWDDLTGEARTEAGERVAELLPEVLKEKYGEATRLNTAFRRDRYKVGRELVDQLVKPPLHVRELAIECLKMTYNGGRRGYVAEDAKPRRIKRQKEWLDYVKRRLK